MIRGKCIFNRKTRKKEFSVFLIAVIIAIFTMACISYNTRNYGEPQVNSSTKMNESVVKIVAKRGYITSNGFPTIVGFVKNTGQKNIKDVKIVATFYCNKGRLIGEKEDIPAVIYTYSELTVLAPNEMSPFKISLTPEKVKELENFQVDKIKKYKVEVVGYNFTDETPYTDFEVLASKGGITGDTGCYVVSGEIKNTGQRTAEQVKVIGVFYDDQGRIIDVEHAFAGRLQPGQIARFEMRVSDGEVSKRIKNYEILVEGL